MPVAAGPDKACSAMSAAFGKTTGFSLMASRILGGNSIPKTKCASAQVVSRAPSTPVD